MVLNREKFTAIMMYLFRNKWGPYKRQNSTILYWVDPRYPKQDYRTLDAYVKQKEREGYDGQDG